MIALFAIQI